MRALNTLRGPIFWACACLMLIAFQYLIFAKERVLASGRVVLAELAPFDPRSLMQGDYMDLSYALNNTLRNLDTDGDAEGGGFVVVRAETDGKASFVRVHNDAPLAEGEYLLRFGRSGNRWRRLSIKPESFFFQEGHGRWYERAKYGIFRCEDRGQCLLTGLADADGHMIVVPPEDLGQPAK